MNGEISEQCIDDTCESDGDVASVGILRGSKEVKNQEALGNLRKYFERLRRETRRQKKVDELKKVSEIYHMEECKKMIQVLRRLEYCDEASVLVKGRVACEISTGDELVLTEMMFNGDFLSLPVEEVIPLLSCIVFDEWDNDVVMSDMSMKSYKLLGSTVEKIGVVMRGCLLEVDTPAYLKRFSYELMDVVRMWVCGHTFSEICAKTSVFEGSIIRCFRRLEELLRQMCCAARSIGNIELENLFAMGISKIKRDIVFASSLYL
jgi:ATP-dependent RNA helicase DOB1